MNLDEIGITRPPWMQHAACRGMPTGLFYVDVGEAADDAKTVCASCPVQPDCLDHAITTGEKHGIWGGQPERKRRSIRRDRNRARRANDTERTA